MFVKEDIDRFWSKVLILKEDECWPWLAGLESSGYGQIKIKRKNMTSNKVVLMIKLGRELLQSALHTCDNRKCCNPNHIYEGSQQQNVWDKYDRKRETLNIDKGSEHILASFTYEEVQNIRLRCQKESKEAVAKDLMVSESTIRHICPRLTYKNVL